MMTCDVESCKVIQKRKIKTPVVIQVLSSVIKVNVIAINFVIAKRDRMRNLNILALKSTRDRKVKVMDWKSVPEACQRAGDRLNDCYMENVCFRKQSADTRKLTVGGDTPKLEERYE
jgi:hypothetical protein